MYFNIFKIYSVYCERTLKRVVTMPGWSQGSSSDGHFPANAISPAETVSSLGTRAAVYENK